MQTAPAAAFEQMFQLCELALCHVFVAQTKTQLSQHIVKPQASLGVLMKQGGQSGNRILPVVAHSDALLF